MSKVPALNDPVLASQVVIHPSGLKNLLIFDTHTAIQKIAVKIYFISFDGGKPAHCGLVGTPKAPWFDLTWHYEGFDMSTLAVTWPKFSTKFGATCCNMSIKTAVNASQMNSSRFRPIGDSYSNKQCFSNNISAE